MIQNFLNLSENADPMTSSGSREPCFKIHSQIGVASFGGFILGDAPSFGELPFAKAHEIIQEVIVHPFYHGAH
ncbi:hypothetical protein KAI87_10945, partial [Myxococcota bacterium]|nr:hypothetical protein [Myxococcota bacterium]